MSLEVIERPRPIWDWNPWSCFREGVEYELRDSDARDGEWHAVITLPHAVVEYEGKAVPAFEGDVERIAWERARSRG